jgi:hypothetical protein
MYSFVSQLSIGYTSYSKITNYLNTILSTITADSVRVAWAHPIVVAVGQLR